MLLCLHEENAVAIAHGYAKVTGRAMAAAVHSNVGLMHATMAIFNAWCDRMPVLLLGATGPVDAAKRRPWIDWIHTARDQGALVRDYTKWDDQPASPAAAREALLRASWIAHDRAARPGLRQSRRRDAGGEARRAAAAARCGALHAAGRRARRAASMIAKAAALLRRARTSVILIGRVSRRRSGVERARRACRSGSARKVVTDLKVGASFPTDHPLHLGAPGVLYAGCRRRSRRSARPT